MTYDTGGHPRPESTVFPVIRRKPLPPSAEWPDMRVMTVLPGSEIHPTLRRTWYDENGIQVSTEAAGCPISRIKHDASALDMAPTDSPQLFGDQLYPVLPYREIEDDCGMLSNNGDTIVCTGQQVNLRIHSATIFKSKYRTLIEKLQAISPQGIVELKDAGFVRSTAPIHFLLELPVSLANDSLNLAQHRTSIRNFFAALRNKPIVGEDVISELIRLQQTATNLLGGNNNSEVAAEFVRNYVKNLKLDDCRYFRTDAIRTLGWCEKVKWEKGYLESFAHCVGMMSTGVENCEAFANLSQRTKELLTEKSSMQQHDIQTVESVVTDFNILDCAPSVYPVHFPGYEAARAFEQFLREYYSEKFGTWPPATDSANGGRWFTRTLAQSLQEDFGGLYDLLVDTNVTFGAVPGQELAQFLSYKDGCLTPLRESVCSSQLPLQLIVSAWNIAHDFDTMPHPCPLLPKMRDLIPVQGTHGSRDSLVKALREVRLDPIREQSDLRNAYMSGTNSEIQLTQFSRSFLKHETTTRIKGLNTQDARLGRWFVVHAMMQLLTLVAVDIQGLWYNHGVPYFLNADLTGCPPWEGAEIPRGMRQASVEDSWCWIYAKGMAEAKTRKVRQGEKEKCTPKPKYHVNWNDRGRWKLVRIEDGAKIGEMTG